MAKEKPMSSDHEALRSIDIDNTNNLEESPRYLIDPGTSITTSPPRFVRRNHLRRNNNNRQGDEDEYNTERDLRQPLLVKPSTEIPKPQQVIHTSSTEQNNDSPFTDKSRIPYIMVRRGHAKNSVNEQEELELIDEGRIVALDEKEVQSNDVLHVGANDSDMDNNEQSNLNDNRSDASSIQFHHHHHKPLPWYKNPYQRMAMISNLGTSYNVVNISLVLPIVEQVLLEMSGGDQNTTSTEDSSAVASSLLAGMILGQVVGGALGDSFLGLAGSLRLVMIVQIIGSLGSSLVPLKEASASSQFYWSLSGWRFVLGLGAGAVYPLAACLSVEQAGGHHSPNGGGGGERTTTVETSSQNVQPHEDMVSDAAYHRRVPDPTHPNGDPGSATKRVVRTFSMQGVGFWVVPALALPLLHVHSLSLMQTWRILLALGSLPGFILLYLQWKLYKKDYERDQEQKRQLMLLATTDSRDVNASNPEDEQLRSEGDRHTHMEPDTVGDREFLCEDSDGEVGTFLDSSPDLSSEGCYGESEYPAIRQGWWASIFMEPKLCQKLLGTAATWFLFDVLFYGNTLFQPIVVETAFGPREGSSDDPSAADRHLLQQTAMDSFVLTSIALPGYAVAGWLIGEKTCGVTQSARYVMLQGFAFMSILYLVIGLFWNELRHFPIILVVLYGLTFFFANYGPNTTTFILPSLVYSAECRSTFNGLSAAAGKLGALTGATLFAPAANAFGDAAVMKLCAGIGFVSFAITACFVSIPKHNGASHHELLSQPPPDAIQGVRGEESTNTAVSPPLETLGQENAPLAIEGTELT